MSGLGLDRITLVNDGGIHVNELEIGNWLDTQECAYRDPVSGDFWVLRSTPRIAWLSRLERIRSPQLEVPGVRVGLDTGSVWLDLLGDQGDLARGLEFVRWLVSRGVWKATLSNGTAIGVVQDASRLFPPNLPSLDELKDDLTYEPVISGTLTRWYRSTGAEERTLWVHSSGAFRYETDSWRCGGRLSKDAGEEWNAAIAAVDPDDPDAGPRKVASSFDAVDLITREGSASLVIDLRSKPLSVAPARALVDDLVRALEGWHDSGIRSSLWESISA